jgi:hypothetical protein
LNLSQSTIDSLLDLSQRESVVLSTLPTDLISCGSVSAMIRIIFEMYSIESSLYKTVNEFLRSFPVHLIGKLLKELGGVISYIYLLQSSIEQWSLLHPLVSDCVVYRGVSSNGSSFSMLYESVIGEVIVWRGFTSTSLDCACVISSFVTSPDGILFEITLHPGDVAAAISEFSSFAESEILIAACSGFVVDEVDTILVEDDDQNQEFTVPRVQLTYFASWFDFDLDIRPPRLIL